jgi:hypothetical protein
LLLRLLELKARESLDPPSVGEVPPLDLNGFLMKERRLPTVALPSPSLLAALVGVSRASF